MNYKSINDIFPGPPLEVISKINIPKKVVRPKNNNSIFIGIFVVAVIGITYCYIFKEE
jgi:hypothetical protein